MEEKLSITNLARGAAIERFDIALQSVMDNIQDPNTAATAKREVILKMTFKPTKDRDLGDAAIEVVPKLAPIQPFGVRLFLGVDNQGNGFATERHPQQPGLFDKAPDKAAENVRPFSGKEANA